MGVRRDGPCTPLTLHPPPSPPCRGRKYICGDRRTGQTSVSPPAEPGVYLNLNYWRRGNDWLYSYVSLVPRLP